MWKALPKSKEHNISKHHQDQAKKSYQGGLSIAERELSLTTAARLSIILRYAKLQWDTPSKDIDPSQLLCDVILSIYKLTLYKCNFRLLCIVQDDRGYEGYIERVGGAGKYRHQPHSLYNPHARQSRRLISLVSRKALTSFITLCHCRYFLPFPFFQFPYHNLFTFLYTFIYLVIFLMCRWQESMIIHIQDPSVCWAGHGIFCLSHDTLLWPVGRSCLVGWGREENFEQAHSIFYILQQYSTLTW